MRRQSVFAQRVEHFPNLDLKLPFGRDGSAQWGGSLRVECPAIYFVRVSCSHHLNVDGVRLQKDEFNRLSS